MATVQQTTKMIQAYHLLAHRASNTTSKAATYFSNHLEDPQVVYAVRLLALLIPLSAIYLVYQDYHAYLSLGPGGTPQTPLGYLKIKLLSVVALRNVYKPAPIPPHFRPQTGHLTTLPKRAGKRPTVAGIAPQRQQDQKSNKQIYHKLAEALNDLAENPQNLLLERTSCFEKNSAGLFSAAPITGTCRGEVCHAHPCDGSLHMTLHPADAKLVLENGWGERHPLAKGGWFRRFVPKEFMMIYAPRDEQELEVIIAVVCAAAWWVSGIDVDNGNGAGVGRMVKTA